MILWRKKQEEEAGIADVQVSTKEERLKSKFYYEIFLVLIKYTPFVILVCEILYSIFSYLLINPEIINIIGCVSIPQLILLYVASYVFKYCKYYRLSLHSILLVNILALFDSFVGIPISDLNILRVYLVILLGGIIAYIKFKVSDSKNTALAVIKYIPILLTIAYCIASLLIYLGINIISLIVGLSLPILLILLFISCKFNFCYLHKMSLCYTIVLSIINLIHIIYPITIIGLINLIGMFVGLTLIPIIIYSYNKITEELNQIKHIKELYSKYLLKDHVKNYKKYTPKIRR